MPGTSGRREKRKRTSKRNNNQGGKMMNVSYFLINCSCPANFRFDFGNKLRVS